MRMLSLCLVLAAAALARVTAATPLGQFSDHGDIGSVSRPGTATYDAASDAYTIGASGVNMWFKEDAMHYVWKQATGDLSLAGEISFVGTSSQPHRKACLVIRQNLEPGSPYVDVAVHGEGLTSLQFRQAQDGETKEIQSNVTSPARVRLDKIGDMVYLSVARAGESPQGSGCSVKLPFTEPFYVGLAVSAHDNAAFESAVFSRVQVGAAAAAAALPRSDLKIITLPTGDRRVAPATGP